MVLPTSGICSFLTNSVLATWAIKTDDHWILQECEQNSEKATKFCEIFTLLLNTVHTDKSKVKILQNFVAYSEYMNLSINRLHNIRMVSSVPIKHWCQMLLWLEFCSHLKEDISGQSRQKKLRWRQNFSILNKWIITIDRFHDDEFRILLKFWSQNQLALTNE